MTCNFLQFAKNISRDGFAGLGNLTLDEFCLCRRCGNSCYNIIIAFAILQISVLIKNLISVHFRASCLI